MNEYRVELADADIRLDRWFKRHFPHVGHGWVEKSLRKGLIRLDGKKAKASEHIYVGQVIRIAQMPELAVAPKKKAPALPETQTKKIRDWVLYQDANIIVINKPPGLAVQGGSGQKESVDALLDGLREKDGERPKLVHRLDKDTSGVLLLARSAKAAGTLSKAFAQKDVEKIYWALAVGAPKEYEGVIDLPLAKMAKGKDSREAVAVDEEGQRAITEWRVIERLANRLAWMELKPITGRTHQLRVHLAAINHPIVGDGKYGGSEAFIQGLDVADRLHLHARRVRIPSIFGKALDVTAPLPKHMQESWKSLGLSER